MRKISRPLCLLVAVAAVALALLGRDGAGPVASAQEPATKTVTVQVTDIAFDPNPNAESWGRVTSEPAGIDCPGDCSEDFPRGSTVDLTVEHASGYSFVQWDVFGNDAGPTCSATDVCELTVGNDAEPEATVVAALRPEGQLFAIPQGAGTVRIDPVEEGRQ